MATHPLWSEDYWLLILQLYLAKPVGIKPLYDRKAVQLSCELHIPPQYIHSRLVAMEKHRTPVLEVLWDVYANNSSRLKRDVKKLKAMKGFGHADDFYKDVVTHTTFERDFTPLPEANDLYPVSLVVILDLYFRLTPSTMVAQTPEVKTLASRLAIPVTRVIEVLMWFLHLDPYVHRHVSDLEPSLQEPCQTVWQQYGYMDTQRLSSYADQLMDFFRGSR